MPASEFPNAKISPCGRFPQDKVERSVAPGGEDLRDAGPDQVHVDGQRRGRGRRRQPPLALCRRLEPEAQSAVGLRDKKLQVAGRGELLQVLVEEGIVAGRSRRPVPRIRSSRVVGQDSCFRRHVRAWLSSW